MTYDTKIEDLSPQRQKNFYDTINRLGYSEKWGKAALTINTISNWEQYGFGCFNQDWLQKRVALMLKGENITLDVVNADLQTLKEEHQRLIDWCNDDLEARITKLEERIEELWASLHK